MTSWNNVPLDDNRTLSLKQFCEVEGLSVDQYWAMKRSGWAPTELWICDGLDGASAVVRITPAARREWHEALGNNWRPRATGTGITDTIRLTPLPGSTNARIDEARMAGPAQDATVN